MALVKICPTCGEKNSPSEMLCKRSLTDISGISPIEEEQSLVDSQLTEADKKVDESERKLILKLPDGNEIKVKDDGDVLGRDKSFCDILQSYKTISRRHARITYESDKWFIEDLNSTNGTYIDDSKLHANTKKELNHHQKVGLSSSLEMTVIVDSVDSLYD